MAGVADVDSLIVSEAPQSGPTVASRLPAGRQLGSEPSPSRGPMACSYLLAFRDVRDRLGKSEQAGQIMPKRVI